MSLLNWKSSWNKALSLLARSKRGGSGQRQADWAAPLTKYRRHEIVMPAEFPVMTPEEAADTWFTRLKETIVREFGATGERQRYLFESGVLDSGRQYLYLQPLNKKGLLMERAGDGWVLAFADKIVSRDTFMRTGEAWDIVRIVAEADGVTGEFNLPKVVSRRFQDDSMPFSEYRKRLLEAIRCMG